MKILIIIPAHNEGQNIYYTLKSLEEQSFDDFRIVVVNDGSEDETQHISEEFAQRNPKFQVINLKKSLHEPGAKVVRTFNKGLHTQNIDEFDIICKFDADIIFPKNYLEEIHKVYKEKPNVGMVSGIVKVKKTVLNLNEELDFNNDEADWQFENLSSKDHIRGPIKSYRKECFVQMNGLRAVLGWDNIDVMLAKMNSWETFTIKDLWVKHLRPTAYKYKKQKAEKLGEYFYNIGLDTSLTMISSAKSAFKSRSLGEFFITMKSFLTQKHDRLLSAEEIQYIRKLRWQQMLKKLKF